MKYFKVIFSQISIIICGIFLGWFLLTLAYKIPTERISSHIQYSTEHFGETYPRTMTSLSSQLDLFTDALMLLISGFKNEKPAYVESLLNRSYFIGGDPTQRLREVYNKDHVEGKQTFSSGHYARYWHGYTSILKPMLYSNLYGDIRTINMCIQIILFAFFCLLLAKKQAYNLIAISISFWLFLNPVSTILTLQFSSVITVTFLALIFLLLYFEKIAYSTSRLALYFTIIGVVINFFDLLTFPLVSLGIPLLFYIHLRFISEINLIEAIKTIFLCCWSWLLGFGGMWAGKWVLASIVTEHNIVMDAYNAILHRSSNHSDTWKFDFFEVVQFQFRSIDSNVLFLLGIVAFSMFLFKTFSRHYKLHIDYKKNILYLIVLLLPFIWYKILPNHSHIHHFFTYRNLSIFISSILFVLFDSFKKIRI